MITKQQIEDRLLGVGGSDVPTLLGYTKQYKTPFDLYQEKVGLIPPNQKKSILADEGNILEAHVLNSYEDQKNVKIAVRGEVPTKIDAEYPFMRVNADGILSDGGLVEAKTTSCMLRKLWGDPGTGQIPKVVACQTAYCASVYDAPYVDVPVRFMGTPEFQIYAYSRNIPLESMIRKQVISFWINNVSMHSPPMAQTFSDLVQMYTETTEESYVQMSDEVYSDWEKFLSLQNQIKTLEEECEHYKLNVAKFMEDREYLLDKYQNKVASYKYNKEGTRLDTAALKKHEPIVYSKYQAPTKPTRVFRVLGSKS